MELCHQLNLFYGLVVSFNISSNGTFAPFTICLHKKYPYATVLSLITLTILIDNIDFSINLSYLNY